MKYLLAFLTGAAAGVVGTYLYFNNKLEKIVDKKVNEQMEEFLASQARMLSADEVEEVTEEELEEKKIYSDKPETQEKSSIEKVDVNVRTNYRNPEKETYNGNDGIEEDEDDDDDEYITDEEVEELMKTVQNRMDELPKIIDEDDMLIGYNNEEYFWHPKGNIITDAFDHNIEEKDFLDRMLKPVDWRKELKGKRKIIVQIPEECANYTIWNEDVPDEG